VTAAGDLDDLSPTELKQLVLKLLTENAEQKREIAELREEIARLKGLKGRPQIKPSGMEAGTNSGPTDKPAGRRARGKMRPRVRVEDTIVTVKVPPGSRFKGYEDFVVQDLVLRVRVIRYRRERWVTPDGRTVIAPLPPGSLIWRFYADLKAYRINPTPRRRRQLRARFDRIFCRRTGFVTLDRLLARLHANKVELLAVLDRPEIPLHTNGSERDIRCHVTKRKVSGGTRSDAGRDCRDAFLGLAKTCAKLGIAFWDYLGSRLGVSGQPTVLPLPDLIRCRGQPA
jgi:hypothetical protein